MEDDSTYQRDPRVYFKNRVKRKGEAIFKETFGAEINFDEVEESFNSLDQLHDIANTKIKEPPFPVVTFIVALYVDLLILAIDLLGDETVIIWFILAFVKFIFAGILMYLMWGQISTLAKAGSRALTGRVGGKNIVQNKLKNVVKKKAEQYIAKRALFTFLLKLIPFASIFGSEAFFVVLAHNKNKKTVKKYLAFSEAIGKALHDFYRRNPDARG